MDELDSQFLDPESLPPPVGQIHRLLRLWVGLARRGDSQMVPDAEDDGPSDDAFYRAFQQHQRMLHHRQAGRLPESIDAAVASVELFHSFGGVGDDFMHLWPSAVETAIDAGRLDVAEDLLQYVAAAPPGLHTPVLDAHLLHLTGRLGAARDDAPEAVEADLRAAIAAFEAYSSPVLTARAQESLGHWLDEQGRDADAEEQLSAARAAYASLGALGWLAALDTAVAADGRSAAGAAATNA